MFTNTWFWEHEGLPASTTRPSSAISTPRSSSSVAPPTTARRPQGSVSMIRASEINGTDEALVATITRRLWGFQNINIKRGYVSFSQLSGLTNLWAGRSSFAVCVSPHAACVRGRHPLGGRDTGGDCGAWSFIVACVFQRKQQVSVVEVGRPKVAV